jgi:peptide/nickel transport system substrate-binding protein
MKAKNQWWFWCIAVLCQSQLSGCKPSVAADNPVQGRPHTMILHMVDDPVGLNPVNTVGATTVAMQSLMFDHLIGLDPKSLLLVPKLAEAMPEVSEDKRSFTFKLREGLKFADKTPLVASDVVFSFKALMNPYVSSAPRRAELHNFQDCIALDERRVVFKLRDSGPFNLNRLAINFFVIPKHIYDPNNISDGYTALQARLAEMGSDSIDTVAQRAMVEFADFFEDEKFQREKGYIVGSGRYVFDAWKAGQYVRLVKNLHYWNAGSEDPFDAQHMDTLVYKIIPDIQTALQALKSGEIDFSDNFDANQYHEEMVGPSYDKHFGKVNVNYPLYEYIGWNQKIKDAPRKTFFADAKVRMALSQLVDVKEIIHNVLHGTASPIISMVYEARAEYNRELQPIAYNEQAARQLLAEAGWEDHDGDGTLDKVVQGQKVDFAFKLSYKRGKEIRKSIARHVQDKFAKVGIQVEVQDIEGSVLLDRLKQHEVEAWLGGWAYDSDEQDLFSLFHSSQIVNEGFNWGSYSNPAADSTMAQITVEWDTESRLNLHRKIQKILYDDQPYTLLFANSAIIGWNKRLENEGWYGQRPCYDPGQFHLAGE